MTGSSQPAQPGSRRHLLRSMDQPIHEHLTSEIQTGKREP